jgi:hypothetical protein
MEVREQMSRRPILILIALLATATLLGACNRMVSVQTGERIVCTYGEVTTDTIHTIEVPASEAGKYKVIRMTVTCDRHKRLEALYAQAQASIVAGDLTGARATLSEVVRIEPQFKNAQQQLDAIAAGVPPVVDTSVSNQPTSTSATQTAGGSEPAAGKQPVGPVASLATWVPQSLPGYTSQPIVADVFTLTRQYRPAAGGPTDALVVVVEQYKDATAARNAIKTDLGRSYSVDASTATVNGRSVYFGTDSHRFAIAAWNENGVVVAVEGSSRSGKPATLKSHLLSLVAVIVR